jgi:amidase
MRDRQPATPVGRRAFLKVAGAGGLALGVGGSGCAAPAPPPGPVEEAHRWTVPAFELDEITLDDLQAGLASGRWTSVSVTEAYLARIEAIDRQGPALRSVIETNPDAVAIARDLDAERAGGSVRGPLHGVPILIKDNIGTADPMTTTA